MKSLGIIDNIEMNNCLIFKRSFEGESILSFIASIIEFGFIGDYNRIVESQSDVTNLYKFFEDVFYYKYTGQHNVVNFKLLIASINNNKKFKKEFLTITSYTDSSIIFSINIKPIKTSVNIWLNIEIKSNSEVTVKSDIIPYITDINSFIEKGWKLFLNNTNRNLLYIINDSIVSEQIELTELFTTRNNTISILNFNNNLEYITVTKYEQNHEGHFYEISSNDVLKQTLINFLK
jgi:hypothetical protein